MKKRNKKIVAFIIATLAVLFAASMYGITWDEQTELDKAEDECKNAPHNRKVEKCQKYEDLYDRYYGKEDTTDDDR